MILKFISINDNVIHPDVCFRLDDNLIGYFKSPGTQHYKIYFRSKNLFYNENIKDSKTKTKKFEFSQCILENYIYNNRRLFIFNKYNFINLITIKKLTK
jgi:hypothetical protein